MSTQGRLEATKDSKGLAVGVRGLLSDCRKTQAVIGIEVSSCIQHYLG